MLNTHLPCIPTNIPTYISCNFLVLNCVRLPTSTLFRNKALWRCCNSSWGSHNLGVSYRYRHHSQAIFLTEYLATCTLGTHPQLETEICWFFDIHFIKSRMVDKKINNDQTWSNYRQTSPKMQKVVADSMIQCVEPMDRLHPRPVYHHYLWNKKGTHFGLP